jgi:hypothetical protein
VLGRGGGKEEVNKYIYKNKKSFENINKFYCYTEHAAISINVL